MKNKVARHDFYFNRHDFYFNQQDQRACLVMDFMEGGDLLTDLEKNDGRFPEETARYFLFNLHMTVSLRKQKRIFLICFSLFVLL